MEYRCRLGTTSGEIIEGVYVAQSEAALRRELEDKGLHVLSLKPAARLGGSSALAAQSRKIKRHEFLVFNQELATLLKAGMPLVQSLDILRSRLEQPGVQVGARRCLREGARRHGAVGRLRGARRPVSVRLHRLVDGRRAVGQPRRGAAAVRGVLEDRSTRSARKPSPR